MSKLLNKINFFVIIVIKQAVWRKGRFSEEILISLNAKFIEANHIRIPFRSLLEKFRKCLKFLSQLIYIYYYLKSF